MRCKQVQNLLPELMDGALATPEREAVTQHLRACPECAKAEAAFDRAFGALHQAAVSPNGAPDLWAAFSTRLGADLTCQAARELIPQRHDAALAGTSNASLASHLASCAGCAAEAAAMDRSLARLDRAAASIRPVDLWPAFSARTAGRPARVSAWSAFVRPVQSWLSGPRPVLLAGAAAVIVLLAQVRGLMPVGPPTPENGAGTLTARNITPPAVPVTAQPGGAAVKRDSEPSDQSSTPRLVRHVRQWRTRPHTTLRRKAAPSAPPAARVKPQPVVTAPPTEVLASNTLTLPSDAMLVSDEAPSAPPIPTAITSMPWSGAKVMPEVLQAVALLAGLDEGANSPFGAGR